MFVDELIAVMRGDSRFGALMSQEVSLIQLHCASGVGPQKKKEVV
jgi:hypothetical protein